MLRDGVLLYEDNGAANESVFASDKSVVSFRHGVLVAIVVVVVV